MPNFSVLTNSSSASAILMLNKTLGQQNEVQNRMNTGLRVSSAKDDSSTFAIAMGMRSDVAGFKKVRENLASGASTVAVASSAANEIGKQISSIKEKVTQAKGNATGREAIQLSISNAVDQIKNMTAAAQLNGVNLIDGSKNGSSYQVTSSLNRTADGTLSLASIDVAYQDLSVTATGGLQALNGLDVTAGSMKRGTDTAQIDASRTAGVDTAKTTNTSTYTTVDFTFDETADKANGMEFNVSVGGVDRTVTLADVSGITDDASFVEAFNEAADTAGFNLEVVSTGANAYRFQSKAGGTDANVAVHSTAPVVDIDGSGAVNGNDVAAGTVGYKAGGEVAGYTTIDLGDNAFKANDTLVFSKNGAPNTTYTFDGTETKDNLLSKLTTWAAANDHDVSFQFGANSNDLKITANRADQAVTASGANQGFNVAAKEGSSVVDFGSSQVPTLAQGDKITISRDGNEVSYTFGEEDVADGLNAADTLTRIGEALGVTASFSGGKLTLAGDATSEEVTNVRANIASVTTGEADFDGLLKNIDAAETKLKDVMGVLGASEARLSSQSSFMDGLIKSVNDGIGTLVDADMAEESARFQALQTQQQLGIQALSIANSAPQAVLSLFR